MCLWISDIHKAATISTLISTCFIVLALCSLATLITILYLFSLLLIRSLLHLTYKIESTERETRTVSQDVNTTYETAMKPIFTHLAQVPNVRTNLFNNRYFTCIVRIP